MDLSTVMSYDARFMFWLKGIWDRAVYFVDILPRPLSFIIHIAFYLAVLGIVMTHVRAIVFNRDKWKEKYNSSLTFSYFRGTGQFQRKLIYKDAHTFLKDKSRLLLSAAGAGYYIGNYETESKLKAVLLAFVHIPLVIVGSFEMIFRVVFGSVYLWIANFIHWLLLGVLNIFAAILTPFWSLSDKSRRKEQHCPHCYRTFKIPGYVCPSCGKIHKNLVPADTGIFVARCECGKFLPSALLSGRSRLGSVCPECEMTLAVSDAKEFTLQLIGGNTSGKTAFLSAFQHTYREINKNTDSVNLTPFPTEQFDELEKMYLSGTTIESSKTSTVTYSIVHNYKDGSKDSLVVYDIPDEVLVSGVYEQNPLNFAYSDGIVIIVDPTSLRKIREESEKKGEHIPENTYSTDEAETEDIIIEFIQQFSRLSNRSSSRRIKTPIAVVINKSDIKAIGNRIGKNAVLEKYKANPGTYNNDINAARNKVCRDFLISYGMSNTINNLESVFTNVNYFAVSAVGHISREGTPFTPINVIEPVAWIAGQTSTKIKNLLIDSTEISKDDGFEDATASKVLDDRYKKAEKLLASKEYKSAEEEFKKLGSYRDSQERADSIKLDWYEYAKGLFNQGKFEQAVSHFTSLGDYSDSATYRSESNLKYAESLIKSGDFKKALVIYESLGNYKGAKSKCTEVRYSLAEQKEKTGDPVGALEDYNRLGDYNDSKQKARLLLPKLIKKGVQRNLTFGKYKWRVLSLNKEMALIITETVVGQRAYNEALTGTTWKDSSIRKYLNSEFLYDFDDREKKMIFSVTIKNENNSEYGTSGGEDTIDAVFLPSVSDMKHLFENDTDRMPESGGANAKWCWLRSQGGNNSYAAIVDANGSVSEGGNAVNNKEGGFRPAMWITL